MSGLGGIYPYGDVHANSLSCFISLTVKKDEQNETYFYAGTATGSSCTQLLP